MDNLNKISNNNQNTNRDNNLINSKNIVILAAGPPKVGRQRHLEIFNNQPLISYVINKCELSNNTNPIYVVINKDNNELNNYLIQNHSDIIILKPQTQTMLDTFKTALYINDNSTLIVAGDLTNLQSKHINAFLNTDYKCSMYRLKHPWGKNLKSKDKILIRRADIGDSILLINKEMRDEYLSQKNIDNAKMYFNKFYPNIKFNENKGNHIWTWLDYAFFFEISNSKINVNETKDKKLGTIYIDDKVYLDND